MMGIGTSMGGFYDDDHHFAAAQWDHKYDGNDNNVLDPDILNPEDATNSDKNIVEPITKTQDFITEVNNNSEANGNLLPKQISDIYSIAPMVDTENGVLPMMGGTPETVGKAALQIGGETFTGQNHGEAFEKFMTKYPEGDFSKFKDGFMTSKGRFVSREEAFDIAKKQDQIKEDVLPSLTHESTILLSEDIKGREGFPAFPSARPGGRLYTPAPDPIPWPFSGPEPDLK